MIKQIRNLAVLFTLSAIIAGCGNAGGSGSENTDPDTTLPTVTKVLPSSLSISGDISLDEESIVIALSEAIDTSTLTALNNKKITSTKGTELTGRWTFDASTNELTFTFDSTPLPANEKFIISINGEVTDKAGNALSYSVSFDTKKLYNISVEAVGLESGETVTVTQKYTNSTTENSIELSDTLFVGSIDSKLDDGDEFLLSVSEHPANRFCALSTAYGKISSRNAAITLNCHELAPYSSSAPQWNDYYFVASDKPAQHGGERRALTISGLSSCDGINTVDKLGMFDWDCEDASTNDSTQIRVFSTGLKTNKGLSNLINFDAEPSWKENSITVKNGNGQIIKTTDSAIWWNNPLIVTPSVKSLSIENAIYVHIDKNGTLNDLPQAFEITASKVGLVINPAIKLYTQTGGIKVQAGKLSFWIEGKIDAQGTDTGINISSAPYGRLNNVVMENAHGSGISVSQSPAVKLSNVSVINSGEYGLIIDDSGEKGFFIDVFDSTFSNNTKSGIFLSTTYARLINVNASSNQENGLVISKGSNVVSGAFLNNNVGDGLLVNGVQNNLLSQLTISNNNGYGIHLSKDSSGVNNPRNNNIHLATIANNKMSAVHFGDSIEQSIIDSNKIANLLDAYNASIDCTSCEQLVTITIADTAIADAFASVSTDSKVSNYDNTNGIAKSTIDDYAVLENAFRSWSNKNAPSETEGSGSCVIDGVFYCTIRDWSLAAGNSLAIDTIAEPATQLTFDFIGGTSISYLENSLEINSDNIGNNNGFCEANETCLLITNNGSYQGHGNQTNYSGTNDIWTDLGIALKQFETNGY